MQNFFELFIKLWTDIFGLLSRVTFSVYGVNVSLTSIFFAFLVTGFIISIFWRGAKS